MIYHLWCAFCRFWIDPQYQREIGEPLTISLYFDTDRMAREHVEHRPSRFSHVEHYPSRFSH